MCSWSGIRPECINCGHLKLSPRHPGRLPRTEDGVRLTLAPPRLRDMTRMRDSSGVYRLTCQVFSFSTLKPSASEKSSTTCPALHKVIVTRPPRHRQFGMDSVVAFKRFEPGFPVMQTDHAFGVCTRLLHLLTEWCHTGVREIPGGFRGSPALRFVRAQPGES